METETHTLSLESILSATRDSMQNLLGILQEETTVLKKNDLAALEVITAEKINLTAKVEENEKLRINFLTKNNLNPNKPEQWLQSDSLRSLWNEIKLVSEKSQKQNQVNGLVINGSRRRVQTQIEIFSSSAPAVELTYSSSGASVNQRNSKTLAHA